MNAARRMIHFLSEDLIRHHEQMLAPEVCFDVENCRENEGRPGDFEGLVGLHRLTFAFQK